MTEQFLALNAYDIATRIADEGRPPLAPLIRAHDIDAAGEVYRDERVRVRCALVEHPPVVPAFAFRFDTADRSIVFSGDTAPCDSLVELARGADVLVHEVLYEPALDAICARLANATRLRQHLLASHTTEDQVRVRARSRREDAGADAFRAGRFRVRRNLARGGRPSLRRSDRRRRGPHGALKRCRLAVTLPTLRGGMAGRTTKVASLKARTTAVRAGRPASEKLASKKPSAKGKAQPRTSKTAAKRAPKASRKLKPAAKSTAASGKRAPMRKPRGLAAGVRALAIRPAPSTRELLALREAELALVSAIQRGVVTKLGFQEIVDIVGDKLRELFSAPDLAISWFDERANLVHMLYVYEHGRRISLGPSVPRPGGIYETMRKTHLPVVIPNTAADPRLGGAAPGTDMSKSMMVAPIFVGDRLLGDISIENHERENAFGPEDARLLTSVATSLGVALESAHLFDETERLLKETEQRNAELAVINGIQQGVAAKLDFQAIVDLVGDKLRNVFHTDDIGIRWYDYANAVIHHLYEYEHGVRLTIPADAPDTARWERITSRREPSVVNTAAGVAALGIVPGTDSPKSHASVPIIGSDRVIGSIAVENFEREYAFGESDIRLLTTVASSMGVALENARLFDETERLLKETEQRNAELAVINSIQQGVAAKLDFQAIVDLVGDKLREVFHVDDIGIRWFDHANRIVHYLYDFEHGVRLSIPPAPPAKTPWETLVSRRESRVLNTQAEVAALGVVPGTDTSLSTMSVPIVGSDQVIGGITIESFEREHAFAESDVRLLTTVASSMGVALENARLFDETQRLLKETEQRAAELALINSVQRGLAAELDFQAIIDLVGDKLREVFATPDLGILWHDETAKLLRYMYTYEHGFRISVPPQVPTPGGTFETIARTRQPFVCNTLEEMQKHNIKAVPGTDPSRSMISVPVISGDRVLGLISLENYERENAYGAGETRLLTTIAASLGTALESARLFDETQRLYKESDQRATELAVINSVQQGMAQKLEFQSIVDLVGDKLREVFATGDMGIAWYDEKTNLGHFLYVYEHGKRLALAPQVPTPGGIFDTTRRTRQPVVLNTAADYRRIPGGTVPGTDDGKSLVAVPIISGDRVLGNIRIENYDRENAFGEAEIRLLTTIAASLGNALENARLFAETQRLLKETEQRAAELSVINSVQQGLAAELDFQAIIDLVGDKIAQIFDTGDMSVGLYDAATKTLSIPYYLEHRERFRIEPMQVGQGFASHVIRTRKPLVINRDIDRWSAELGSQLIGDADATAAPAQSYVGVPILKGDEVLGVVTLYGEKLDAFDDAAVHLLTTLANTMSVALENARLFDETQRRTRETAALAEVGRDISSTLDLHVVMDRIAHHAKDLLHCDNSAIFLPNEDDNIYRAIVSIGAVADQIRATDIKVGAGIIGCILAAGRPEFINDTWAIRVPC